MMTANSISLETIQKINTEGHANVQRRKQVRDAHAAGQKPRVLLVGPLHPAESGIVGFQRQAIAALSAYADVSMVNVVLGGEDAPNPMFMGTLVGTLHLRKPASWWRVAKALAEHDFDVACVTVWMPFALPAYRVLLSALRRRGIRTATLVHSYVPRRMRLVMQAATRALIRMTDEVVALEGVAEWMVPDDTNWVLHPVYTHHGERVDRADACRALGFPCAHELGNMFG